MPPQTYRSPRRLLAPLALLAVFVALLLVVLGSSGSSEPQTSADTRVESTATEKPRRRPRGTGGVYTVRAGDTLSLIAQRTGIAIERLQELNPDLDARTLVTGQRIKLRQ